jgi:hypothetical protein
VAVSMTNYITGLHGRSAPYGADDLAGETTGWGLVDAALLRLQFAEPWIPA